MTEREKFEAWNSVHGRYRRTSDAYEIVDGRYWVEAVQSAWEAWQAACATPAPAQPDAAEIRGDVLEEAACICDGLTWAIDNAGQRYRREALASKCAEAIRERARAKPDPLHVANERGEGEPVAWVSGKADGSVNFWKGWRLSPVQTLEANLPLYLRPLRSAHELADAIRVLLRTMTDDNQILHESRWLAAMESLRASLSTAVAGAPAQPEGKKDEPAAVVRPEQDGQHAAAVRLAERMGILRKSRPAAPKEKP